MAQWVRAASIGGLFFGVSAYTLWPVLARAGWPVNHEALWWKFRTLVYAFHIVQGDPLPVWSSEDALGLGTPLPFFYHKLYYLVAGLAYLVTGSVKSATLVTLTGFLIVGCVGLERCLRRLRVPPLASALLAALLPLQSYTLFDWLARGAMAELAACMLVPWLLFSVLTLLETRRVPWHLFVNLLLLALAHSVFGLFGGGLALAAGAMLLWRLRGRPELSRELRTILVGSVCVALFLLPWLLAWLRVRESYSIANLASGAFHPSEQLRGLASSHGVRLRWFGAGGSSPWRSEMSPDTLLFLGFALAGVAWGLAKRGRALVRGDRLIAFLTIALLAFVALQTSAGAPVYTWVPGLAYLQFPRRLIGFEQVLALLWIGWAVARLDALAGRRACVLAAALMLAVAVAGSRSVGYVPQGWTSAEEIEALPSPGGAEGAPGIGEYLPQIAVENPRPRTRRLSRRRRYAPTLEHLAAQRFDLVPDAAREHCHVDAVPRERFETLRLGYRVACSEPATLVVAQSHSGLERVLLSEVDGEGDGWRRVTTHRTPDDPRVRVELPAGEWEVRVELPRLWHAFVPEPKE